MSKDATTAFTPVLLDIPNSDVTEELADSLLDTTAPARKAGVEVAVGGNLGSVLSQSSTESSEVIGLLAAMLILALAFGSLVAMGMPIIARWSAWPPRWASSACSATCSRSPPSGRPWPP